MSAILAADTFEVGRHLAGHHTAFRREVHDLRPDDFVPYPDLHLYDAGWLICLVLLRWAATPAFLRIDRNQRRSPATTAVMAARPDILMAGFSRLLPGCHVVEHADRPKRGVLRWLMTLREHGGALLSTASDCRELRAGECFVFDHSLAHAAVNEGGDVFDFLTVDFEVGAAEARALAQSRGGVNLGPTADCPP